MVVVVTGGYLEEVPCELDFLQEVVNVAPMPGFIKLHHSHVERSHARLGTPETGDSVTRCHH